MLDNAKFIISKSKLIKEFNKIQKITDIVSYSVKTNPYVTKILEEKTNSMFLIHHVNELKFVKDKKKVWFMLQACDLEELNILQNNNVCNFIVDNETDLNILINFINKKNIKINILLRMKLKEHTIYTGKYFVFGMFSEQINRIIPNLRLNKNILKLGVHVHRKTLNLSEWNLIREFEESLDQKVFENIDFLDIGGGIPINYKNTDVRVIKKIYEKIMFIKQYINKKKIKLIIEPGRAIAGPPTILETKVKNVINNNIIINCSVYNSALDTIVANVKLLVDGEYDPGSPVASLNYLNKKKTPEHYLIKGCTPCSLDIFRYRVYLKEKPKIGDKLTFLNAGAYIYYSDFCSLDKPEIEFVE